MAVRRVVVDVDVRCVVSSGRTCKADEEAEIANETDEVAAASPAVFAAVRSSCLCLLYGV